MKILSLVLFASLTASAQFTPGSPTQIQAGPGDPTTLNIPCNSSPTASILFDNTSLTSGNTVYKGRWIGNTCVWIPPFVSPILATATTGTFASQTYLLSGCTAIQALTIAGATQSNGFNTAPTFATAPTAGTNVALLNIVAWFSGTANTVNVQGCASGVLGTIPAFSVKVQMY